MNICFNHEGLFLDGKNIPLVAGECHYWRLNPLYWEPILDIMQEAGLEIVSTYVCWDFHEVEKGIFDFEGKTNPSRNLAGFLDLCQKKKMWVFIRPGPFIYAEWPTNGPAPDVCGRERLDEAFLERSREWIQAVCRVLVPRQATQGGPILLLQVDNEVAFPLSTGEELTQDVHNRDYNRKLVTGLYRKWLKARYGDINEINRTFGTTFHNFSDIALPQFSSGNLVQNLDAIRFSNDKIKEFLRICQKMYRDEGIEIPTYTNIGQFLTFQDWSGEETVVNTIGIDNYMPAQLPGDQPLVVSWYYRLARTRTKFPWSPEFQAGIWVGMDKTFGVIDDAHVQFMGLLGLALGIRGLNYYMFVDRDNWHYSPVNERGEKREFFASYQKVISIARALKKDTHLADVGLLWDLSWNHAHLISCYRGLKDMIRYWMDFNGPKENSAWWRVFCYLSDTDTDFDLVDATVNPLDKQVLIYTGEEFVDVEVMRKITEYVENGGKLVVTTQLPTKDLTHQVNGEMEKFKQKLEQSPQVISIELTQLGETLVNLGVNNYIHTPTKGVWSFVYRTKMDWVVFVANTLQREVLCVITFSEKVVDSGSTYEKLDLITRRSELVSGQKLLTQKLTLSGREVQVWKLRRLH